MDTINSSYVPEIVLLATYNLVKDYLVRRKDTVIRCLLEKKPNFVVGYKHEQIVGIVDIARYHEYLQHGEKGNPPGIWRDEWDYFVHGHGCWLKHRETKEKFDWDMGDP